MKIKLIKTLNSTFLKYLLWYIIILVLPTMIIFSFMSNNVIHALKSEIKSNLVNNLEKTKYIIDKNLNQLTFILNQISINRDIITAPRLMEVDKSLKTISELRKYAISSNIIEEIAIYFRDDEYIYTSSTSCVLTEFVNKIMRYEGLSSEKFIEYVKDNKAKRIIPIKNVFHKNNKKSIITYLIPVQFEGYGRSATIIFFLDNDYITKMLSNNDSGYSTTIIMDESNKKITYIGDRYFSYDYLDYINRNYSSDKVQSIIEIESKALLYSTNSTEINWKFISIVPIDKAYIIIKGMWQNMLVVMVVIFLVGAVLIYIAMIINYKPIQKLNIFSRQFNDSEMPGENEILSIKNTLEYLYNEKNILHEKVAITSRSQLFQLLLSGKYTSNQKFYEISSKLNIKFNKDNFCVVIFQISMVNKNQNVSDFQSYIVEYLDGYLVNKNENENENKKIFIANVNEFEKNCIKNTIEELHTYFMNIYFEAAILVTYGKVYKGIENISLSYKEAVMAYDYRFIKGVNCVISYDSLLFDQATISDYPHNLFEGFKYALNKGEISALKKSLDDIYDYIKASQSPIFYVRSLAYEIINILYQAVKRLGNDNFAKQIVISYSKTLADFDTIDELMEILQNVCTNICNYIVQSENEASDNLLSSVKRDIEERYTKPDFSVQALADLYDMTPTNLTQYFKSRTNITLIDYITSVKMEKAKKLILKGELSLNCIAEQVGYTNTSSFIRRFKQLYGITPRQYAENHQN